MTKLFFLSLFTWIGFTTACDCPTSTRLTESVEIWNYIFKGTVKSIEPAFDDKMLKVNFTSAESLREEGKSNTHIYTHATEKSCGYLFEKGKSYIVFAQKFEDGFKVANKCSATMEFSQEEYSLIKSYFKIERP